MIKATMMTIPSASTWASFFEASPTSLESDRLTFCGTTYGIWFSQAWIVA
jgi:hypothetical protein